MLIELLISEKEQARRGTLLLGNILSQQEASYFVKLNSIVNDVA